MVSPVKYLRNKNGNGKLYGNAEAINSLIDKCSNLHGETSVFDSEIIESEITESIISRSSIKKSNIYNSVIFATNVIASRVACELVATLGDIESAVILGNSRITDKARVFASSFKDLTVTGDAVLDGWGTDVFDGQRGYIASGIWQRPPRVLRVGDLTITESVEGRAFVGCREKNVKDWLAHGERIGMKFGTSQVEINLIRAFLLSL